MKDNKITKSNIPVWPPIPDSALFEAGAEDFDDFVLKHPSFMTIVDEIPSGISIISPDLSVLYINKKMREWFVKGKSRSRVKCYKLFHNEQKKPCLHCPAKCSMESKNPSDVVHECGMSEETGEPMYMHIHSIPILNSAGNVSLIIEYSYNLTEQRKMSLDLEEARAKCFVLEKENALLKKNLEEWQKRYENLDSVISENMDNFVKPALEYFAARTTDEEYELLSGLIDEATRNITSKGVSNVAGLSARELQIANMTKDGYSSKQIADSLCLTKKTIDYHRANIRKKLNLNSKTNLQVYLKMYL